MIQPHDPVPENSAPYASIGDAVAATDSDNDTLTYTLGGTDASSFGMVAGQGDLLRGVTGLLHGAVFLILSVSLSFQYRSSHKTRISVGSVFGEQITPVGLAFLYRKAVICVVLVWNSRLGNQKPGNPASFLIQERLCFPTSTTSATLFPT